MVTELKALQRNIKTALDVEKDMVYNLARCWLCAIADVPRQGGLSFRTYDERLWRRTPIFKTRRIVEVPQLASRDMAIIETSPLTPYRSLRTTCMVEGASNFEQLVTPALRLFLDASLADLEMLSR